MSTRINWIRFLLGSLLLTLLTSCARSPQETPTPEPTAIPTHNSIPPTPSPEPIENTFEVTIEGSECIISGPTEVPKGKINIAFDIKGDRNLRLGVFYFLDGKTYQDYLGEVYIGPEVSHPWPYWIRDSPYYKKKIDVWTVTLKEIGEHAIVVGSYIPSWREYPCASFEVIERPSE
jgi:hypothetical protein